MNIVRQVTGDRPAPERLKQLLEVARVGRFWLQDLPPDSPQRDPVLHMSVVADELARSGDDSPDAMTTVRAMLCVNCRQLHAAQEKCSGATLDRCVLLNGPKQ